MSKQKNSYSWNGPSFYLVLEAVLSDMVTCTTCGLQRAVLVHLYQEEDHQEM